MMFWFAKSLPKPSQTPIRTHLVITRPSHILSTFPAFLFPSWPFPKVKTTHDVGYIQPYIQQQHLRHIIKADKVLISPSDSGWVMIALRKPGIAKPRLTIFQKYSFYKNELLMHWLSA